MGQTLLLMCWLAISGTPTAKPVPLPEELLTEYTVAIHRLDLTKVDPADAQATVAYLLLRSFDPSIAKRVEAIPQAIEQFRQAGGREIVLIVDIPPAIAGETHAQRKAVMLILLQGEQASAAEIAGAVHSLFPWLLPSEFDLSKTRRIGSWLVLYETGRTVQARRSTSRGALLREASSAATGAPMSSIIIPNPGSLTEPPEPALVPLMLFMPEVTWAFVLYPEQCLRLPEVLPHIRWMTTEVTFGLPPTVNLTMSVPGEATRTELVAIFKDFGWELKQADKRTTEVPSATDASTPPDGARRHDANLQARIVPSRIVIVGISGVEFSPPERPRYDEHLACGHFREATIRKGQRQYRLSLFSGPKYGVRERQFYTKLCILEEVPASRPAEPIHQEAWDLVDHDIEAISIPFAVGAVRYDPTADEILLVERREMGNHKRILKHMYRVLWRPRQYEGTNDRFSQEAEITRVLQSDNRFSNWDFASAPVAVQVSPPGIRGYTYYATTQPGDGGPATPTTRPGYIRRRN
jgi:hypothetical protein